MSSKVENLLFCLIGLSDPFGYLSIFCTDFSFPRCLGSGVLAYDVFPLDFGRVSRISCFSFLSAFFYFVFLFPIMIPTCLVVNWQMLRLMQHCKTKTVELL